MKFFLIVITLLFVFTSLAFANLSDLKLYKTSDFLISSAPTGCMPKGMKLDPVGQFLYIAEMCGKIDPVSKLRLPSASIFNLETKKLIKTLVTPVGVLKDGILANTEVEFSRDELWGLISRADGDAKSEVYKNFGLITVVNSDTQNIAKYIPTFGNGSKIIAKRPLIKGDLNYDQIVYVANYFSDNISIINIANLKEDGNLDGSTYFKGLISLHSNFINPESKAYQIAPRGIAFTHDGKYAFILSTETGSLIIVDAVKHQQIAELPPIDKTIAGRDLNLRHIVISNNGEIGYLGHMRGNAISKISIVKLVQKIEELKVTGKNTVLPSNTWTEILIPFQTSIGPKKVLVLEDYPADHPNFPNQKWGYAHPNTIVLDPVKNRYLFISCRTSTNDDDSTVDPKIKGKIDIYDTKKERIVFSLVGGAQPTALEVSKNAEMLISAGLIDDKVYFYNLKKILEIYEKNEN